jgi:hypothetical protein
MGRSRRGIGERAWVRPVVRERRQIYRHAQQVNLDIPCGCGLADRLGFQGANGSMVYLTFEGKGIFRALFIFIPTPRRARLGIVIIQNLVKL